MQGATSQSLATTILEFMNEISTQNSAKLLVREIEMEEPTESEDEDTEAASTSKVLKKKRKVTKAEADAVRTK